MLLFVAMDSMMTITVMMMMPLSTAGIVTLQHHSLHAVAVALLRTAMSNVNAPTLPAIETLIIVQAAERSTRMQHRLLPPRLVISLRS